MVSNEAKRVAKVTKLATNLVAKNDANLAKFSLNRHYNKIPERSELSNMVANDAKVAKLATNLASKTDANLALPTRFHQVLIESPL
ncbi:hypothetical protein TNCV_963391 [Trichonephila clavipes]|nr:hypothetical protein TNCV_963391 [Trichonephila clavipes]